MPGPDADLDDDPKHDVQPDAQTGAQTGAPTGARDGGATGRALITDETAQALDLLARRYRKAGGMGMQVLTLLGGQAEGLIDRLPGDVRGRLEKATASALGVAVRAAQGSRGMVGDQPGWLNTAATTAMGAAGGFGGLPAAMAELPVTTTVLMRAILGVAAEHGFDPAAENIQFDCIEVFAASGPLGVNESADLSFLTARIALTGKTVQGVIARVAPKLAVAMGQKLAAQTIPVLGAMTGAATNFAYTSYYQEIAHVHFGLRRLAIEADVPHALLVEELRARVTRKPLAKRG